jgi:hypothetical protein
MSLSLGAIDVGGTIDNASTLYALDGANLDQRDKISLWLGHQSKTSVEFFTLASYTYSLEDPLLIDIELLKLDFPIRDAVSTTIGRFILSDFTKMVVDHPLDGFRIVYNRPSAIVTAAAGYTGLLFKEPNLIRISRTDSSDMDLDDVYLAPPRLVELIQVVFPELLRRQDLMVSLIAQQDLRQPSDLIEEGEENKVVSGLSGGRLHTFYLGVGLTGPISAASSLYSDAYLYTTTGTTLSYVEDAASITGNSYQYKPILSFLAGFNLSYYPQGALSSRITGSLLFSSGDADAETIQEGNTEGISTQFIPISRPSFGVVFSPQLGNLIMASLSYSLKPFGKSGSTVSDKIQAEVKAMSFIRPSTGAVSGIGIDPLSDSYYLATEVDGIVNFRAFSDLAIALSTGLLIPYPEAFSGEYAELQFLGRLEFSFSF